MYLDLSRNFTKDISIFLEITKFTKSVTLSKEATETNRFSKLNEEFLKQKFILKLLFLEILQSGFYSALITYLNQV